MKVYLHFENKGPRPSFTLKVLLAPDDMRTIASLCNIFQAKYSRKHPSTQPPLQSLRCFLGASRKSLDDASLAVCVLADGQDVFLEEERAVFKCQRMGCDAQYYADENEDVSACKFHPDPPVFHDGKKFWGCCQQESYDFSLFMDIPGCALGCHSTEPPPRPSLQEIESADPNTLSIKIDIVKQLKEGCLRCSQGFFCSDHNEIVEGDLKVELTSKIVEEVYVVPVDPDLEQLCRNKGCGNKFTERENTEKACNFHPGPAVFHERKKGWGCCDKKSFDFDEFLSFPPCTWGRHNSVET